MVRLRGIIGAILVAACSTNPTPTGPGTATIEVHGRHGECLSIGGCTWVAILTKPDEVETLLNRSEAELSMVGESPDLGLRGGLPAQIENGHYRLTFEERYMSDAIDNIGPRDYGITATCFTDFAVSGGRAVLVVWVSFPQLQRTGRRPAQCTARAAFEEAP